MRTSVIPELDEKWVTETLQRVAEDLALIIDHPFFVHGVKVERADRRPAADGGVHISFKLALQRGQTITHGAVLIPLPQAVLLAAWLHMMSDDEARRRAGETQLDQSMKDGLLEIGNFVAGAAEASCRNLGLIDARVVSEGCQGVKAGVRPAFAYTDGQALTIGRAETQLANGKPFVMLAMLPAL
jgi:hypothetical protein